MSLSRSVAHQNKRNKRMRRYRRIASLALILIGIVVVAFGIFISQTNLGGMPDWLPFGGKQDTVADRGDSGTGDDRKEDPASEGEKDDDADGLDEGVGTEDSVTEPDGDVDDERDETGAGGLSELVSLSFAGDLLPGEYLLPLMKKEGYDYPYLKSLLYLSEPDLMAGNLEMPITLRGTPIEGTPYVYKGTPDALPALKDAGFDVVSLANNHAMDQGVEGLLDTIDYLNKAGIGHMGAGSDDTEAFAPLIKEAKGIKVAYIGLSKVIPFVHLKADRATPGIAETYETTRAVAAIAKAKEQADLVVVMVHWGDDGADQPVPYQRQFAREYIDAGADLVIGAHPHVLQGFEMYNGKWIAYSLGNFIFTVYPKGTHAETGVLDAICDKSGDCTLKFNPMLVIEGQPTPIEGEAAGQLLDRLASISYGASIRRDGTIVSTDGADAGQ